MNKGRPVVLRLGPASPAGALRKASSRAGLILAWNEIAPQVFAHDPERFNSILQALLLDLPFPLLAEYVAREVELSLESLPASRRASLA